MSRAILLVGERVPVRRVGFHVVDGGDRLRSIAEGGMTCDVVDPLAADIDDTAVAQRFQMLLARSQHPLPFICIQTLARLAAAERARRSASWRCPPLHAADRPRQQAI